MDDLNVHHFWGISPAVDLISVAEASKLTGLPGPCVQQPVNILQAASYDARHTITTLCQLHRHPQLQQRPVHLYVYEEEPEVLLRHLLLLSILLDGSLLAKERMETLLEVHSNVLLREKSATYLEQQSRALEALLVRATSSNVTCVVPASLASLLQGAKQDKKHSQSRNSPDIQQDVMASTPARTTSNPSACSCEQQGHAVSLFDACSKTSNVNNSASSSYDGMAVLEELLDLSLLRFQDKDRLVEALAQYRAASLPHNMVQTWDARQRKWYSDRYDARTNMVDWDYHMVLARVGTPGQDADKGSVIHFQHFRHWRLHGVAYELRDAWYNCANRSLLSTAYGRTREFKDRNCKDVGRSVCAWGYWGDCLNSPYHCWGTKCEDDAFYKFSNKQWSRTAVDIAEHNVLALLHELRHAEKLPAAGSEAHRARTARGPTSLADLQEASACTARAQEAAATSAPVPAGPTAPPASQKDASIGDDAAPLSGMPASSTAQCQQLEAQQTAVNAAAVQEGEGNTTAFIPSATFQGPKAGYAFKHGQQGMGYYWDAHKQQAAANTQQAAQAPYSQVQAEPQNHAAASAAAMHTCTQEPQQGTTTAADADASGNVGDLQRQAAAVSAAEAALDVQAAARLHAAGVRVIPVLGGITATRAMQADDTPVSMLAKLLTGRPKFAAAFQVLSVGHRHVHLLGREHHLATAAAPGALLLVESACYLLQLPKAEQSEAFAAKVSELATAGGWDAAPAATQAALRTPPQGHSAGMAVTDAHLVFAKQQ